MLALISASLAGLVAGLVHVFSGPDHLAAILPFAIEQPRKAVRIGLFWGLGHGLGVVGLGALFWAARAYFEVDTVSQAAELLVGVLLVGLGLWAIRRSRKFVVHTHPHDHDEGEHAHPHVHVDDPTVGCALHARIGAHQKHQHSSFGIGFVHGLAGVGHLVGAGPLVALSGAAAGGYLASYLLGGIAAMVGFATLASTVSKKPTWIPRSLLASGVMSVGLGIFWVLSFAVA